MSETTIESIRCSSLPAAFRCPGSLRLPLLRIEDDRGDGGAVGNAVHESLRPIVDDDTTRINFAHVESICAKWGVSKEDVLSLVFAGVACWQELRASFVGATSEGEYLERPPAPPGETPVLLTGHVDASIVCGKEVRILDWKSGRVDADYGEQIRGYMALALLGDPTLESAVGVVVWLRERDVETYRMTRVQMVEWVARFYAEVVNWDGIYHPGSHCNYCRRSANCPALVARAQRDIAVLHGDGMLDRMSGGMMDLSPAFVLQTWDKVKMLRALLDSFEAAMKVRLHSDGVIEANGKKLSLIEEARREVDTFAAWPILQSHLDDETIAACVKVSISKVEDAIAKKAGRGKGAQAKRDFAAELENAKAVSVNTIVKMKEGRSS